MSTGGFAQPEWSPCMCLALRALRTMAPQGYTTKFDSFLSLDWVPLALQLSAIQGKQRIKFCLLATLVDYRLERVKEDIYLRVAIQYT